MDQLLYEKNPTLHSQIVAEEKMSVFGKYKPLDQDKVALLSTTDKNLINSIMSSAKKNALTTVAIFPVIMLVCYLILIFYFRSKGGYKAIVLDEQTE